VRAAKTTAEYYRVLQAMLAKVQDGHTYVHPARELQARIYADPPLLTRLVEDQVIVVRVDDPAAGVAVGDEIIAVDGIAVKQYAEENVKPYVFASTPEDRANRTFGQWLLSGDITKPVRLTIRDVRGRVGDRTIARKADDAAPKRPLTELRVLDGNVGLLALNSFGNEKIRAEYDALWEQIAKTDALIIDLRENGGGNSGNAWHVLATLTDKPFRTSRWRTRRYLPSHRAWNRAEEWDEHDGREIAADGKRHYAKPVIVLTSVRTFSAAEDFTVTFDAMERGTIVGTATGGSTGQPLRIDLPGGGFAGICTKRDQYPDGREFVGVGVQPDVIVEVTIAGVRAGRDAVLERALQLSTNPYVRR
jgi:carboxyl-terminal processing protease